MSCAILFSTFCFRVMPLCFFVCFDLLILCNFLSCTPHNLLTVRDIFVKECVLCQDDVSHSKRVVRLFLVSELCHFDYCKIHETLKECVLGQNKVLHTIMVAFHFSFHSYGPLFVCCCFLLVFCNFHSCTPNILVIVYDIFLICIR